LKFEKNWPVFSNFDATSSKNPQEIYYGQPSLIKFIRNRRSFAEAFCLRVKRQSNDFSPELAKTAKSS